MVLVVVRASDGAAFPLYKHDLHSITTLDELRYNVLSNLLSIQPDHLICMNEEGAQLRDETVPHLALLAGSPSTSAVLESSSSRWRETNPASASASRSSHLRGSTTRSRSRGAEEKRIYVFDREHLDADPEVVANGLAITEQQVLTEAPLEPQDPLHSHIGLSLHHLDSVHSLIHSIALQHASLHLALSNLHRVNTGTHASLQVYLDSTQPNLQTWQGLLESWEDSMIAIGKVGVVSALLGKRGTGLGSSSVNSTAQERYLGDYVSRDKMGAVKEGCKRVLGKSLQSRVAPRAGLVTMLTEEVCVHPDDLVSRTQSMQATVDDVLAETAVVQTEFDATSRDMEDLDACAHDAEMGHQRIEELVRASEESELNSDPHVPTPRRPTHAIINSSAVQDPTLTDQCFEELTVLDSEHRNRIRFLVQHKNAMTHYLLTMMQRISGLQSDIAIMPSTLGELDHDARTKTDNFKHLARLEGLIPAYVATIVEIVRRREYDGLLRTHAKGFGEALEVIIGVEREQRGTYRQRYAGKLPWEVKGLSSGGTTEEVTPFVDLGVRLGSDEHLPELTRSHVEALLTTLRQVEGGMTVSGMRHPIREARILLESLVQQLDEIKIEFERLAKDRSPIAASSSAVLARTQEVEELKGKIRSLEEAKFEAERELQRERSSHEEEVVQLNLLVGQATAGKEADRAQLEVLRGEMRKEREERRKEVAKWEKAEREARRDKEEEARRATDEARSFRAREDELDLLLKAARKGEDDLKDRVADLDRRHLNLSSDHEGVRGELDRAKSTIEELENAIKVSETTCRDLTVVVAEKERKLRDQSNEAELDRAVLEKEMQDLRATIERHQVERERAAARESTLEEIASGLREQVERWTSLAATRETELVQAKGDVDSQRGERERALIEANRELAKATTAARMAIKLAARMKQETEQVTSLLRSTSASQKVDSSQENVDVAKTDLVGSVAAPDRGVAGTMSESVDYEQGKIEDLIVELSKIDKIDDNRDSLTDAVRSKIDALSSATKKWIKEAKAYRERALKAQTVAADKIAFRNFAIGDLALFLPTRDSAIPVWAAFNVSCPHHFLSAKGTVQEQTQTRTWIVARITSLTEQVADLKDPASNPYLLAPGTKFFHLEVEPWSSKDLSRSRGKRLSSGDKTSRDKRGGSPSTSNNKHQPSGLSFTGPDSPSQGGSVASTSAVVVEASTPSKRPTAGRRSVSEGGQSAQLPSNATSLARSEYAVIEEEEAIGSTSPTPPSGLEHDAAPSTPAAITAPSGLAVSLFRSRPPSPAIVRSDPFNSNPFAVSSSPPVDDSFEEGSIAIVSPRGTDFEPAATSAGAVPAFLPSTGRKTPSASGSQKSSTTASTALTSTKLSPRYVRSSPADGRGSSKPRPIIGGVVAGGSSNADSSATSPSSVHGHLPRSASSASSILSASLQRARPLAFPSTSPLDGSKAAPTVENASSQRWTAMTDSLIDATSTLLPTSSQGESGSSGPLGSTTTPRARRPSESSLAAVAAAGRRTTATAPADSTRSSRIVGEVRKVLSPK
ncbi:BZ3500_MvSof-1268-A1-R1_Chr3-1g06109 [Microbotryum saponariae]|uniref:Autophagy-related protein 11 n=1 Tax=Microbotryum saponariae TaxID=289078 RepID=A0A2X0L3V2_9BASI|nr:BZ3500_MvSof-1268-A1-R1_Chr3-1g06109 [Microbotryum saponariae]SDA03972.1 BZ3501_MvSof-1269-A2-R1_Chr3-2g05794 [Microbotryum saponariae]